MILSTDVENHLTTAKHPLIRLEGNFELIKKKVCKKPTTKIIHSNERLNTYMLRLEKGMISTLIAIKHSIGSLSQCHKAIKEYKAYRWERMKYICLYLQKHGHLYINYAK